MEEYQPTAAQMAGWPRHIVATSGLTRDAAGRVLLVRSGWRGWELPGGQVEQGEDLLTALRREILEESGCVVAPERLVGVYSNVGPPYIVQFLFLCTYVSGAPHPSIETPEVGWFVPADALRLVTRPSTLLRLQDALAAAPGVVYRVYRLRPFELLGAQEI
jgi:8-oxo-dGTP diphosphatase